MSLPKKCLVDTNVPINANLANDPATIPDDLVACVQSCVDAIEHVMKKGEFVIDSGDELFLQRIVVILIFFEFSENYDTL